MVYHCVSSSLARLFHLRAGAHSFMKFILKIIAGAVVLGSGLPLHGQPARQTSMAENPDAGLQRLENRDASAADGYVEQSGGPQREEIRRPEVVGRRGPFQKLAAWTQRVARAGRKTEPLRLPQGAFSEDPLASPPEPGLRRMAEPSLSPAVSVLVIGDSMSLGGFGKGLDSRLRQSLLFGEVSTFLACGTNPLSWLTG